MILTGAVEGVLDEAVLRRVVMHSGSDLGTVHGRKGKPDLLKNLHGYNQAAQFAPWVVLVDLDRDCNCAPEFYRNSLPEPGKQMCFRIAVRAVESWLLADCEHLAKFLGISSKRLPRDPDNLDDPKRALVDLARRSRRKNIWMDMVPRESSGRSVGQGYTSRMREFVDDLEAGWRVEIAAERSASLRKCLECLHRLRQVPA